MSRILVSSVFWRRVWIHLLFWLVLTETIFMLVGCADILKGHGGGCVLDDCCHGGRGGLWGRAGGRSWGCRGEVPHVLFEGTVIPKGVVALGGQLTVDAIEAQWVAVALEGGVEAAAVFCHMFHLGVPGDATDPAAFVGGGVAALGHVIC